MSFSLVIIGGTGDLAWRKLIPALFQAFRHGTLPPNGRIVGVSRDEFDNQSYASFIQERFKDVELAKRPTPEEFERFSGMLEYVQVDLASSSHYVKLADALKQKGSQRTVIYLAIAPNLLPMVVEGLVTAGLAAPSTGLVLEKPLGMDLASNRAINELVRQAFGEHQIFRIDHYLGKPSVQNLLALRFGNALFEPVWNREHIASIEISIAEELGTEQRGAFYDATGALRDMVQNHALQLLCAIAMEPPINAHADAIRDEKLKVLRSLKPWTPESLQADVVRAQYTAGAVAGLPVVGFLDEENVRADSSTETFVALRAEIANWRWAGVPFYVRTGKRMARRDARIVVNFRRAPHVLFPGTDGGANRLVIHLQPKDGVEMHLLAHSQPARGTKAATSLAAVHLELDFDVRFGSERVGAYERLLLDAIDGRLNLFVRADEQEEAWRWVEPVMNAWAASLVPMRSYQAGTWGPNAASTLVATDGFSWSERPDCSTSSIPSPEPKTSSPPT